MPVYKITAITPDGSVLQDRVEFENEDELREVYENRGYVVLECKKELFHFAFPSGGGGLFGFRKKKMPQQDLSDFCFYLGRSLDMGLPLVEAIENVKDTTKSKYLKKQLSAMADMMMEGSSISEAMQRAGVFPPELIGLVKLGEEHNALPSVFMNYADYLDWVIALKKEVKRALSYPMLVGVVLAVVVGIMFGYVIPKVVPAIAALGLKQMPAPTRLLIWIGSVVPRYWKQIIITPLLIIFVFRFILLRNRKIRYIWDKYKLKLPIVGEIFLKSSLSRDMRTIAEVYRNGGSIIDAVRLIESNVELNFFLKSVFKRVEESIVTGDMLSAAMEKTGFFPLVIVRMVRMGEDTGALDKVLFRIASIYEDDMRKRIETMSTFIEPAMQLVMGIILGIIAAGILMPVYNLVSKVGGM